MSEATTRADIKTLIDAVPNIGVVYDYVRFAALWNNYLALFKTTISGSEVIRGWTITCIGFDEVQLTYGNPGSIQRNYVYKIEGYFGLDDVNASEKAAMLIVEDVVVTLRSNIESGSDDEGNYPASLTVFENRDFGGVLCHYAEVTLLVEAYV